MGDPYLNAIAASQEETAIDAIVQTLGDDPGLTSVGATIWSENGIDEGARAKLPEVAASPKLSDIPLIRLIDGAQPLSWSSEGFHRGPLTLEFELFCGRGYRARRRIIKAFIGALFPQDPTRRQVVKTRLGGSGVIAEKFTMGGERRAWVNDTQDIQRIKATYILTFDDPT
jgi:hypothetical protein